MQSIFGGTPVRDDIVNLKKVVHIIVGTPGRVHDMIQKKFIKVHDLKLLVIDEADKMLSRIFEE